MTTITQLRILRTSLLTFRPSHTVAPFSSFTATFRSHTRSVALRRSAFVRHTSTSTSTSTQEQSDPTTASTAKDASPITLAPTAPRLSPSAANPPSTTRPPPLNLPIRAPENSIFSHLFQTGKAYLTFYKMGLKNIYASTQLVWALSAGHGLPDNAAAAGTRDVATPSTVRPAATTRGTELLKMRWRHDIRRVPVFALFLLVCGEFTPFVVLALPGLVPFACRIPRQVEKLQRKTEERRRVAFRDLGIALQQAAAPSQHTSGGSERETSAPGAGGLTPKMVNTHVARSLGLVSGLWDKIGLVPGFLASSKAHRRIRFLAQDDALLLQAGGVAALEMDEVKLACVDRGIDVLDKSEDDMLKILVRWSQLTHSQGTKDLEADRVRRISVLLTRKPEDWPQDGDFELPVYSI